MRSLMTGDRDSVRSYLDSVSELGARAGSTNAAMMADTLRLCLLRSTGDTAELARVADRTFAEALELPYDAAYAGFLALTGRHHEARKRLERCTASGLALHRDAEYLECLWLLGEAAILLDERAASEAIYEALHPYATCWAIDGIAGACFGVVAHQLGRLAGSLGHTGDARRWLEQALTLHREAGASLLAAQTEQALRELAAAPQPRAATHAPEVWCELRRFGKVWQLRWHGEDVTVPDSKGMRDMATLLGAVEKEVHVLDMVEATGGPPARAAGGSAGEVLDATARAVYRERLAELEGELAEADAFGDSGRTARLREEQRFLTAELAAALGLGGRVRTAGDPVERARTAVTNRIRTALRAIAEAHPELGRHLERSIRTGRFCSYRPEHPVRWHVTTLVSHRHGKANASQTGGGG
jgi:hypothetical protein